MKREIEHPCPECHVPYKRLTEHLQKMHGYTWHVLAGKVVDKLVSPEGIVYERPLQ